jgi:hypothetical protein
LLFPSLCAWQDRELGAAARQSVMKAMSNFEVLRLFTNKDLSFLIVGLRRKCRHTKPKPDIKQALHDVLIGLDGYSGFQLLE